MKNGIPDTRGMSHPSTPSRKKSPAPTKHKVLTQTGRFVRCGTRRSGGSQDGFVMPGAVAPLRALASVGDDAMRFPSQRAIIETGVKMKDVWIATAGFVLGWLMSKTWQDPGCRVGLVVFLVVTAVMALAFALAVVGHRRPGETPPEDDGE